MAPTAQPIIRDRTFHIGLQGQPTAHAGVRPARAPFVEPMDEAVGETLRRRF